MFTFGSDPEFILIDHSHNPRSGINFVAGTKKQPIQRDGHGYYYDNVLAECAVKPASSKNEAIGNMFSALRNYRDIVRPAKITIRSSAVFPDSELDTGPMCRYSDGSTVRAGRYAGCKEEWCAYTMDLVDPTIVQNKFKQTNLRTAGGHVHLGTPLGKVYNVCVSLVRMLDLFLGLPSLLIDQSEGTMARRELYGSPGRFRQPAHGCEYRTLSNFWLISPETLSLVYDLCEFTVDFVESEKHKEFWSIDEETIRDSSFWNNGGNVADLHVCHGYDAPKLRGLFSQPTGDYDEFIKVIEQKLPKDLFGNIFVQAKKFPKYRLESEWNL